MDDFLAKKEAKIIKKRQELEEEKQRDCTFQPMTNLHSERWSRKDTSQHREKHADTLLN